MFKNNNLLVEMIFKNSDCHKLNIQIAQYSHPDSFLKKIKHQIDKNYYVKKRTKENMSFRIAF